MDAATMEDEWFARNMPGNIRTAEPAANEAVPQFPLDALYPQQHNTTNNRTFDIQQLMRLNQNSPTSPALNSSSDSPTHMLLRLLGLIPGNPAGGDLPAGLPGVLDATPAFKRQGLTVDNIDLGNGQLQNIQELLRNQQPNGLHVPQHSAGLQVSAAEAAYLQHAGNSLQMPDLGGMGRDGAVGSSLQQHAAQLQQAQHASDNHSMSNANVLSILDSSTHSNLLGKQGHDGTQGHAGQYDAPDAFLTHRDLLARSNGVSNGMDHSNAWHNIAKPEPMQDSRIGAHPPDNHHHGATENGSEKNMQDLLESVQRRNPVDTHGWKEVAVDVNVEPEKWPELKQCYENFRSQHPSANAPTPVRAAARTDSPPLNSRRSSARPSPVDALDRPTTTPNKHGRRINPRKGIPMHIMATYALLRLPDHEGNLSDMSAKIEENAFFCKQLDWTPRPGTKTYPRWKDALVGCFKPGRYPHLKKTTRKKEGLTVYALMENSIPEKSCLKPSMLTDVDPASLPPDFDMNNPLVPLRNANNRIGDKNTHDTTSVVTTGIQPMASQGSRGPLTGSVKVEAHAMPGMDSASLANSGLGGGRNSFNGLSMPPLSGNCNVGSLFGDVKPNVDVNLPGGFEQASALIAAAMQQSQQHQ